MSTLDQSIQQLFTKLAERKAKVASLKAEATKSWKTNGTFRLIGASATTNMQTANEEQVEEVATQLLLMAGARDAAAAKLGREIKSKIQGYTVDDWFADFTKRLATINIREEERQLEALEQRLNSVLSPEERRRIEVELLTKEILG